jgi:hypothetical protein
VRAEGPDIYEPARAVPKGVDRTVDAPIAKRFGGVAAAITCGQRQPLIRPKQIVDPLVPFRDLRRQRCNGIAKLGDFRRVYRARYVVRLGLLLVVPHRISELVIVCGDEVDIALVLDRRRRRL